MADEERLLTPPALPFDSDGHLIEVLWSRLSGAVWRHRARALFEAHGLDEALKDATVRLSSAELQVLLSVLRDRARATHGLIARFEAALEAAG